MTLRRDSKAMARLQQRAGECFPFGESPELLCHSRLPERCLADRMPAHALLVGLAYNCACHLLSFVTPQMARPILALAASISPDASGSGGQQPRKRARTDPVAQEDRVQQRAAVQQAGQTQGEQQQGRQPQIRHPLQELALSPDGVPRRSPRANQNAAVAQRLPVAATSPARVAVGSSWLVSAAQPRPGRAPAPDEA